MLGNPPGIITVKQPEHSARQYCWVKQKSWNRHHIATKASRPWLVYELQVQQAFLISSFHSSNLTLLLQPLLVMCPYFPSFPFHLDSLKRRRGWSPVGTEVSEDLSKVSSTLHQTIPVFQE
jgi:hypothetical protein